MTPCCHIPSKRACRIYALCRPLFDHSWKHQRKKLQGIMAGCCAFRCTTRSESGKEFLCVPEGKNYLHRRSMWLHRIGRENFVPSKNTRLFVIRWLTCFIFCLFSHKRSAGSTQRAHGAHCTGVYIGLGLYFLSQRGETGTRGMKGLTQVAAPTVNSYNSDNQFNWIHIKRKHLTQTNSTAATKII